MCPSHWFPQRDKNEIFTARKVGRGEIRGLLICPRHGSLFGGLSLKNINKYSNSWCPRKKHRKEIQESLELGCGKHMARDGVRRVEKRIGNFYFRRGRGKGEKAVSETSLSSKFRTAAALSFPIQFSTERRRSKEEEKRFLFPPRKSHFPPLPELRNI